MSEVHAIQALLAESDRFFGAVTLAIAALALTVTVVGLRRKTNDTYTEQVEKQLEAAKERITELETKVDSQGVELKACMAARQELTYQNFRLYEKVEMLERNIDQYRREV